MKKTLSLLLVLALALGLLTACGGAQSPASTGEAPAESAASVQESAAPEPEDMPGTNPNALIQGEPVEPASAEEPAPEPVYGPTTEPEPEPEIEPMDEGTPAEPIPEAEAEAEEDFIPDPQPIVLHFDHLPRQTDEAPTEEPDETEIAGEEQ